MTSADLKPDVIDCDAKKAARNAALDTAVGVSGPCDAEKAAKDIKEDTADDVRDAVDLDLDDKKKHLEHDHDRQTIRHDKD
jgi:hypothetical protein